MGINAGPTTSTSISDTTIRGNKLVGPFGEDALRINRYHDSGDADPYGILIEGNEITGVRENGNHSTACNRSGVAMASTSAVTTCTTTAARGSSSRISRHRCATSSSPTT